MKVSSKFFLYSQSEAISKKLCFRIKGQATQSKETGCFMLFQNIEKTYPLLSVSIFFLNNSQMFMQDVKAILVVLGGSWASMGGYA